MTYRIYFDLTGCFEVEADSEEEALEKFDSIDDYGDLVNTSDAWNVVIEESRQAFFF